MEVRLPTLVEHPPVNTDYMQPSSTITSSVSPSLCLYPAESVPPLPPKMSHTPRDPPAAYQSPSLSPKAPLSLSGSPYQSPSSSPNVPFSLSPFFSPSLAQLVEARQRPESRARVEEGRHEDNRVAELHQEMLSVSLADTDSCSSFSSLEGEVEMPQQGNDHDQQTASE